ncbi:MAG: GNAT family N-acetyltransferase [Phycisphaerales bacterium]|nr:GNAT family N-acetyltransferase [Phycisphaerales bacterium]
MAIELIRAKTEHTETLARICHLAFDTLHQRHNVHRDVPDEHVGGLIIGGVINRPDYTGVVAIENGRVVGSNFLLHADDVCGVGPITVDPSVQTRGIGRLLMQWVIDEARRQRGANVRVRLFQEAVNTTSLSLYTNLGFRWCDAAAMMNPKPAERDHPGISAMSEADLPEVGRLSRERGGFSRERDAAQLLKLGLPGFVLRRDGRVVGYQIASLFGHAAAETTEDLLALCAHTARHMPPPMAVVIVPMSQSAVFSAALKEGYRVAKVVNAMSIGAYEVSKGPALPSIQC